MGNFGNSQSTVTQLIDEELEEKKAHLLEEIAFLGRKLDELNTNISSAESLQQDVSALTEQVTKLQAQVSDLQSSITSGSAQLQDILDRKSQAEKEFNSISSETKKLKDGIKDLEDMAKNISVSITRAAESEAGILSNIDGHKKLFDSLNGDIADLNNKILTLTTAVTAKTNELQNILAIAEKTRKEHEDFISSSEKEQQEINAKIIESKQALIGEQNLVEEARKQAAKILSDAQTQADALKAQMDTQFADLSEREGNVSLRESWLIEKTDQLKLAKSEVEKIFGKPLNHIKL